MFLPRRAAWPKDTCASLQVDSQIAVVDASIWIDDGASIRRAAVLARSVRVKAFTLFWIALVPIPFEATVDAPQAAFLFR